MYLDGWGVVATGEVLFNPGSYSDHGEFYRSYGNSGNKLKTGKHFIKLFSTKKRQ